ncbi:MAG: hypothetical protein ACYS8Y_10250 [Planctomycetota bacterium]|jgi:hypothetical protein
MSDNTKKKNEEMERLEQLEGLVDRYAQSRVLPLLIPLAGMILNVILLLYAGKLASLIVFHLQISMCWYTAIILGVVVWVLLSSTFVAGRILARYAGCFYKKEGTIELEKERSSVWAWIAYLITFLGPAFMSMDVLPIRWALTIALASFGTFMLYLCKKHKEKALGVVYGGLSLAAAVLTAIGVQIPFVTEGWEHSYFVTLMIYLISAGFITAIVVHVYNRKVLQKIKDMRTFGEQRENKSDS